MTEKYSRRILFQAWCLDVLPVILFLVAFLLIFIVMVDIAFPNSFGKWLEPIFGPPGHWNGTYFVSEKQK